MHHCASAFLMLLLCAGLLCGHGPFAETNKNCKVISEGQLKKLHECVTQLLHHLDHRDDMEGPLGKQMLMPRLGAQGFTLLHYYHHACIAGGGDYMPFPGLSGCAGRTVSFGSSDTIQAIRSILINYLNGPLPSLHEQAVKRRQVYDEHLNEVGGVCLRSEHVSNKIL